MFICMHAFLIDFHILLKIQFFHGILILQRSLIIMKPIKEIVLVLKMKIYLLLTHPQVVPNLLLRYTKEDILQKPENLLHYTKY